MDDERADGEERADDVNENGQTAQPQKARRNRIHEPHREARDEETNDAVEHHPEKLLLTPVEAVDGRQIFILVADVVLNRRLPREIGLGGLHVIAPDAIHPERGRGEEQAEPRM